MLMILEVVLCETAANFETDFDFAHASPLCSSGFWPVSSSRRFQSIIVFHQFLLLFRDIRGSISRIVFGRVVHLLVYVISSFVCLFVTDCGGLICKNGGRLLLGPGSCRCLCPFNALGHDCGTSNVSSKELTACLPDGQKDLLIYRLTI